MAALAEAFRGSRVLVTGASGFKGSWLSAWLLRLGAEVYGLSLPPPTTPSLFERGALAGPTRWIEGDIRDPAVLDKAIREIKPQVVFHLAAQAIVRVSYELPLFTLASNAMGTAHLLEAIRHNQQPCAVVVVTSDKCYANRETDHAYGEEDALGGADPYSASKGCAEIITASWRSSFFPTGQLGRHGVAVASARAGNVIGPGDYALDRLLPDCIRDLERGRPIAVRNPASVRPWQHVLEPLSGYLCLAARLHPSRPADDRAPYCEGWNFGPEEADAAPVRKVVETTIDAWGEGDWQDASDPGAPHEAKLLRLNADKAAKQLDWRPVWGLEQALRHTATGYRALMAAQTPQGVLEILGDQIDDYVGTARQGGIPWAGDNHEPR